MEAHIMAKVDKYIGLFEEVKNKVGDERIAMSIIQEVDKDRRMDEMREEREARNGEPATRRQLEYMKTLGIDATPGVTKKQASLLIDEALAKESD
jgi:hypothetical protein